MESIKNFLIFVGIMLLSTIVFNLFGRICVFVQYGTFKANEDTNSGMLVLGLITGVVLAVYHFCEDD